MTMLIDFIDALDRRRSVASRVLTGHTASEELRRAAKADLAACDDLLWSAPGAPVFIPIRSARADEALAAIRGHEGTHAARRDAYDGYAPSNTPVVLPDHSPDAGNMVPPVRQFRCNEIGGPAWLRKRRLDMLSGVVLLLAVGWLGGVISAVMVL